MKIFITGASGFIGARLAERLVSENHNVSVMLRSDVRPNFYGIERVSAIRGDIFDKTALKLGMQGCDWVFHLAAFTKPWSKDPSLSSQINITGTENVLDIALETGVKKVIITSTAGTMGYSKNGKPVGESTNIDPVLHTLYERTKAEAERKAVAFSKNGLDVIIVNPTRVYGPGKLTKSNSLTKILKSYISGKWRIIPGDGKAIGNYVFVDDVVEGHILAARFGRSGERYILGGENNSFNGFFKIAGEVSGKERAMIRIPFIFLEKMARLIMFISNLTGIPPLITTEWLEKYSKDWIMSSEKAEAELGYKITPLKKGIFNTLQWLKSQQNGIRQ